MKTGIKVGAFLCLAILGSGHSLNAQVTVVPRTVTSSQFTVTWSGDPDAEAITSIQWTGLAGQNLTAASAVGSCNEGDVEFFGNAWGPPDPESGGFVLVGGGTTNPSWTGRTIGRHRASVTIHSLSTGCPPSSIGIPVRTRYRFADRPAGQQDTFQVERTFDFATTPFAHNVRPYIPRLNLNLRTGDGFTEVIYPIAPGSLTTVSVFGCPFGCTGPVVPTGSNANPLVQPLDPKQDWFVIHDPASGDGIFVERHRPRGDDDDEQAPSVQLWIDFDGASNSNASSFLLLSPVGGFRNRLTETQSFCFFVNPAWNASAGTMPPECRTFQHEGDDDDDRNDD
jgi:hypothetical protein